MARYKYNHKTKRVEEIAPPTVTPTLSIISDNMERERSPVNRQVYSSKSTLRKDMRALGLTEIGNEYDKYLTDEGMDSWQKERSRVEPLSYEEKMDLKYKLEPKINEIRKKYF